MTAATIDDFVDIVVVGARACALGWLPNREFIVKLATTMFRAGPSVDLPKLVEDSFGVSSSQSIEHEPDGNTDETSRRVACNADLAGFIPKIASAATPAPKMLTTPNRLAPSIADSALDAETPAAIRPELPERSPLSRYKSSLIKKMAFETVYKNVLDATYRRDYIGISSDTGTISSARASAPYGFPAASRDNNLLSSVRSDTDSYRMSTEGPTAQQWQDLKEEIKELYMKKPLKEMRKILAARYGFRATYVLPSRVTMATDLYLVAGTACSKADSLLGAFRRIQEIENTRSAQDSTRSGSNKANVNRTSS